MLAVLCWALDSCGLNKNHRAVRPLRSPFPGRPQGQLNVKYSLFEDVIWSDGLILKDRLGLGIRVCLSVQRSRAWMEAALHSS